MDQREPVSIFDLGRRENIVKTRKKIVSFFQIVSRPIIIIPCKATQVLIRLRENRCPSVPI